MKEDVSIYHLRGWHGTEEKDAEEILKVNFEESLGDTHWLGNGVYFFTTGVGAPLSHALNWAKSEANKRKITRYAILNAEICVNKECILDLIENAGLDIFNEHREFVLRQIRLQKKAFKIPNEEYSDSKVIEHLKQKGGVEVVVCNMYVRFLKDRIEKIQFDLALPLSPEFNNGFESWAEDFLVKDQMAPITSDAPKFFPSEGAGNTQYAMAA